MTYNYVVRALVRIPAFIVEIPFFKSFRSSSKQRCVSAQDKPSGKVDMEEIFRKVLENASKALMMSDAGKRLNTCQDASVPLVQEEFQMQQARAEHCPRQNCEGARCEEVKSANLPGFEEFMQPYLVILSICCVASLRIC